MILVRIGVRISRRLARSTHRATRGGGRNDRQRYRRVRRGRSAPSIEIALGQAGATLADVVPYPHLASRYFPLAQVGGIACTQAFGKDPSVTSMVEVTALIAPGLLVGGRRLRRVGGCRPEIWEPARDRHPAVGRRRPQSQRAPAGGP